MTPEHIPTHHLHISTGFAFVAGLVLVALVGIVVWAIVTSRRPKVIASSGNVFADLGLPDAERLKREADGPTPQAWSRAYSRPLYDTSAPAQAAPVIVNQGGNDLLTGVLLGEAMAGGFGHRDTVVVHDAPSRAAAAYDPGPSYDSSPSSDSGFSYDSGSSCSSGSDSGGGFDFSW